MFLPSAGFVRHHPDGGFHDGWKPAYFPAADTAAAASRSPQPVLGELPEVGMPGPGNDQFCRDVPLDTLEAGEFGDDGFCIGNEIDEFFLIVRRICPRFQCSSISEPGVTKVG